MTTTIIKKVETKNDLKKFIRFNYKMYKANPYSVPDLYEDMLRTFSPKKNAAFEFCEADYFLAYKNGELVGRVAAIINHRANETWKKKACRFGWIDFIDDAEVSKTLIDTVAAWGKERGMETMEGPLGFTDMDAEGMLIEGFDQLSTMATIYNYSYYPKHMEALGLKKATDWIELRIQIPDSILPAYSKVSSIVQKRYGLRIRQLKSIKEIRQTRIGYKIFDLINEAYSPLYGYSKMSHGQIDQYIREYLQVLDLDLVALVERESDNELIGVGISMGSMSTALQKARGKLWPFGWFHLLKALKWKNSDTLDLLLIGIKPEYQSKGINAMIFAHMIPIYNKKGFRWSETNPELEENEKVQAQWKLLNTKIHKRRRCFQIEI